MMAQSVLDQRWMHLALRLGVRGAGQVWPNPYVGCVIVRNNRVIGRGWTQTGGRPHGEVMALTQAGDATGAAAYVTLEPCAHHGQTPPCAQALIDAGVARVVVATTDPDPRVSGKGIAKLRAAGIEVVEDVCKEEADREHAGFFKRISQNRPILTLKLATSLDGKIATQSGDSQWITGPQARSFVHYLRSTHDAVMVGRGTSVADDPSLTVRGLGDLRQPVRVVLDSKLKSDPGGVLGQTAPTPPVWMFHDSSAQTQTWAQTQAELIACGTSLDLRDVMNALADRGITRVFCEGGGSLAASLIKAGLVDQLITMSAGVAIGGDGINGLAPMGISDLSEAKRFKLADSRVLGGDVINTWNSV